MSILVSATKAPAPRTKDSRQIALLYAAVLVLFAVAQLFTFDEFIELVPSLVGGASGVLVYALAPTLIAAEVFAVPFLLGMALSPAFRWLSMAFGWLAAALWLFITSAALVTNATASTVGFLGTVGAMTPGWWSVFVAISLAILAAWSSWGLWPGKR